MLTKIHLVKAMVFPVVMSGCESWTIKKAECHRIDAFEPWCWRRLLRVPWTERRSNQSILKEISPEYSLEGLMLKLKLQQFAHLMWRADSLEKTLRLGKIEGRRRGTTEDEMVGWHQWLDGHWVWASSGSWWWTGRPGVLQSMESQRVGHNWVTELNWAPSWPPASTASHVRYLRPQLFPAFRWLLPLLISDSKGMKDPKQELPSGFPGGSVVKVSSSVVKVSPMQETWVQSLIQEDSTCHGATEPMLHSYWAGAPEPWKLQILKPVHPRTSAPQQEKPQQWETCTLQLESSPACCN